MSDLSRRDITGGVGLGAGAGAGAGSAADVEREQESPASSGSRALRPRLGPVTDGWARAEIGTKEHLFRSLRLALALSRTDFCLFMARRHAYIKAGSHEGMLT